MLAGLSVQVANLTCKPLKKQTTNQLTIVETEVFPLTISLSLFLFLLVRAERRTKRAKSESLCKVFAYRLLSGG